MKCHHMKYRRMRATEKSTIKDITLNFPLFTNFFNNKEAKIKFICHPETIMRELFVFK